MTAHEIAHAIEDEARAFSRARFTDQASYLEAKDAHCRRMINLSMSIARELGTPPRLSLGTGRRQFGEVRFDVQLRTRSRVRLGTGPRSPSPLRRSGCA
ncbi:hypothetical protein [Methylobacterium iners]|uniref:Uncharacterized protein n=1 Tax=Methylobacterium iners TaxID=418707 RepID=A0ABQ4RQ76_9HYPH|nr:hypothetical protein [Methylobacterium iners]GJD92904.1 hypothetical protein OCOJLMKI_0087 [Methylobacterium iners]